MSTKCLQYVTWGGGSLVNKSNKITFFCHLNLKE